MTQITEKQANEYFTYLTRIDKAMQDKTACAKARRWARKAGMQAYKSRTMRSIDNYGGFMLIEDGNVIAGAKFDLTPWDVMELVQQVGGQQ